MSWTREAVYDALLVKLQTIPTNVVAATSIGRRMPPEEQAADITMPAVYIVETGEIAEAAKGLPTVDTLECNIAVLTSPTAQPDAVRSTTLNTVIDAVRTALKPDPLTGWQTLGGVVSHAWVEGATVIDEGLATANPAMALIPVRILVGQDNDGRAAQFVFDVGALYVTPVAQGGAGAAAADLTPTRLGGVRGVTFTADQDLVFQQLTNTYYAAAAGALKRIRMRAAFASLDGVLVDQVFFGAARQTGATLLARDMAGTIPGSPYQITVTALAGWPAGGTFLTDLGVMKASDGTPFRLVTGVPTTGQYSRSGAVYTFAAADTGVAVAFSALYTLATGTKIALGQAVPGLAPTFTAVLRADYNGKQVTLVLNRCVTAAFAVPVGVETFAVADLDFEAIADASGNVGTWSAA